MQAGNGSNILIDGSMQLTQNGDSLGQVLEDWIDYGDAAANVDSIRRSRLLVTYNSRYANTLHAGSGLDWFWAHLSQLDLCPNSPAADQRASLLVGMTGTSHFPYPCQGGGYGQYS